MWTRPALTLATAALLAPLGPVLGAGLPSYAVDQAPVPLRALAEASAVTGVREAQPAADARAAGTSAGSSAGSSAGQHAGQATGRAAARTPRRYREYVSLGDSWSADVVFLDTHGLPDSTHAPIDCAQSTVNYPKLVAKALGIPVHRDATCGSATTQHFAQPQSLPLGGTNPPQYSRLTRTTDLVTVGIGGNDAGIAGGAMACISLLPIETIPMDLLPLPDLPLPLISTQTLPVGGCKAYFTAGGIDRMEVAIQQSEIKLVRAFRRIRELSPKARILAVDYLAAVPAKGCWPTVPVTDGDLAYLHEKFLHLNAMVRRAAKRGGAELVDTFTPTRGHDMCQAPNVRYAEAYGPSVNDPAVGVPAHPNAAGARAQAAAVLAHLRRR